MEYCNFHYNLGWILHCDFLALDHTSNCIIARAFPVQRATLV